MRFPVAIPAAFANASLQNTWGYKYDGESGAAGIRTHADAAAVSINFWITDDDANLDEESGGVVVYSTGPVGSTKFSEFNNGRLTNERLGLTAADRLAVVPHRSNRAVLFRSALYHESDTHRFKPGYRNRRVNLTLLWGYMESVRCSNAQIK